jgi:hypothetical protein
MPKKRADQYAKALRALSQILHDKLQANQKNHLVIRVAQWIGGIRAVRDIAAELGCPAGTNAHGWLWTHIRANVTAELLHTSRGRGLRGQPKPLTSSRAGRLALGSPTIAAAPEKPKRPAKAKSLGFYDSPRWRTLRFMIIECYGRECMYKYRIDHLRLINVAVRFLSLEPLLGDLGELGLGRIGWVIVGGESGPNVRPMHPDWVRSIRDQCVAAGVPFFFKQWGEYGPSDEGGHRRVSMSGETVFDLDKWRESDAYMHRYGKKASGRMLDGELWDQMPGGER